MNSTWMPSGQWMNTSVQKLDPVRLKDWDNRPLLIVTLHKTEGWTRALEDLGNAAQFDCIFEGTLEDRLPGLESGSRLRELDYRFVILSTARGDEFHAANRILARHGGPQGPVIAVEPNGVLRFTMPSIGLRFNLGGQHQQYLSLMNVAAAHTKTTGKGVRVAVVDTGAELTSVKDFYDVLNPAGAHTGLPSRDTDGHGTAMATLIREVAPDADLFVIRISDQPQATILDGMAGVTIGVVDCRAHILNLSLGFPGFSSVCPLCGSSGTARSIAFETLLRSLITVHEPIYVASAGNDAPNQFEFEYPGAYDFSVVVGSINSGRDRSYFSQYRATGGHNRYAMAPGGETDLSGNAIEEVGAGSSGSCFGTSVATAYFSGMLALFRAEKRHRLLARDVFIDHVLANHCTPHSPANATEYGRGMIQYS